MWSYKIAGLGFHIIPPVEHSFSLQTNFDNDTEGCFLHKFKAEINPEIPTIICEYDEKPSEYTPPLSYLIKQRELTVYEDESYYYLADNYNAEGIISYTIRYRKDFRHALIKCYHATNLFPALFLRTVFRNSALEYGIIEIHSASIEYDGGAILFSGVSGSGKSTHANLWRERYHVPILNGDSPFVRCGDTPPIVCGSPWCGTSRESLNHELPLKAIVFIEQAPINEIHRLSASEAYMRLILVAGIPRWHSERMNLGLDCLSQIIAGTPIYLLRCLPDLTAVEVVKEMIDDQ
ncbi:MAG: hypothetical protein FWC09_00890 [Lachnospiraceae bacterium]|nr:hypothetical protein [Lachnospiraceae bacterium]